MKPEPKLPLAHQDLPYVQTEHYCFFAKGPFSNWAYTPFTVEGITYRCVEQYMMAGKALVFNDNFAYAAIMKEVNPYMMKKLGRAVSGFKTAVWNLICQELVKQAVYAKYQQNRKLKALLLNTHGTLVECNPHDELWACGLSIEAALQVSKKQWRGLNWLGDIKTEVREELPAWDDCPSIAKQKA